MNHSLIFSSIAVCSTIILIFNPALASLSLLVALFFLMGLPHGSLDIVLGKELLFRDLGPKWWISFSCIYLLLSLAMIALWTLWPFLSFIFFLVIAVLHFGFSDAIEKGYMRFVEGITRGLLPLTAPAFFYQQSFQAIIESTLAPHESAIITTTLIRLFIPNLILLLTLTLIFIYKKEGSVALELGSVLGLFMALPPITAFLIYFCFLHSIRHTLTVMKETKKPILSIALDAVLPTLFSAVWLIALYYFLREKEIDIDWMYYLFFMGLAALTLPHMLLVEGLHLIKNSQQRRFQKDAKESSIRG